MAISPLQKYILKQANLASNKTVSKSALLKYYDNAKNKPKPKDLINDITKSVERLIGRELVVGFGCKTAKKWFISSVRLTPKGIKTVRSLFGVQQKLPFRR